MLYLAVKPGVPEENQAMEYTALVLLPRLPGIFVFCSASALRAENTASY